MKTQNSHTDGTAAAEMINRTMTDARSVWINAHGCIEQIRQARDEARERGDVKAIQNWNVQLAKMTELAAAIDKFL